MLNLKLFISHVNQGHTVYGNKGSTYQHTYIQHLREGVHNFFGTFIEVLCDRPPGHDWELEPGFTCSDYLFGMLQELVEPLTLEEVAEHCHSPEEIIAHMAAYNRAIIAEGSCGSPRSIKVFLGECNVDELYA
ncbi:glucose-6-phosphate isomerase 1, chloroplastic-like isoform X1 [Eucalyptus grandis]|uniref:glucose-6-phosphate isomerase 1, chloroplastic-like isoform X1 n=1 Tax=Eucalyptus grandis TaxID=71139 RepID=UPI00192F0135|nr:glucose-6-phosphate isomerase 1, chloroplastic-like isoform X1 [Eucalyptus grandis]